LEIAGLFPFNGPGSAAVAYGSILYSIRRFYWRVPWTLGFLSVRAGSNEVFSIFSFFLSTTGVGTHPLGHLGWDMGFVRREYTRGPFLDFSDFLDFLIHHHHLSNTHHQGSRPLHFQIEYFAVIEPIIVI
jgi:hypothetical protein